jgi:hypothetical protein
VDLQPTVIELIILVDGT